MKLLEIAGLGAALVMTTTPLANAADDRPYNDRASYDAHRHHCDSRRRSHAVTGTVIGGVAGGVIGNRIDHGHLGGTLIGAGAGALAGHEIGKHTVRCR